jgi:hypothetical protein
MRGPAKEADPSTHCYDDSYRHSPKTGTKNAAAIGKQRRFSQYQTGATNPARLDAGYSKAI